MFQEPQDEFGFERPTQKRHSFQKYFYLFGIALAYYVLFYEADGVESKVDDSLHGLDPTKYHGRYPHSLLTLFFPYTLLRDVVLDQPVSDSDIPFFWHVHNSDEKVYKNILKGCYGLQLIELNDVDSIKEAKELEIVKGLDRYKHVITSPFVRETSEIFTTDHFGRMICFFRHPLDYDLHPSLPVFEAKDNWMTRLLSNWHKDEITFKELGVAKHVVRQCCLMGEMGKMKTSIIRIAEHMNWKFANGMSDEAGQQCIDNALEGFASEKWADHDSPAWQSFYKFNRFDAELYELSQSTWRHQIQTIIPWKLQVSRNQTDGDE